MDNGILKCASKRGLTLLAVTALAQRGVQVSFRVDLLAMIVLNRIVCNSNRIMNFLEIHDIPNRPNSNNSPNNSQPLEQQYHPINNKRNIFTTHEFYFPHTETQLTQLLARVSNRPMQHLDHSPSFCPSIDDLIQFSFCLHIQWRIPLIE
jgi:hypothetical protein